MKEIIVREDFPSLGELCPEYNVRVLPGRSFVGSPFALILFHPTLVDMIEERKACQEKGIDPLTVAIVEPFRRLLFEAAFPYACIIDEGDKLNPVMLSRKNREKQIRLTDKEKRTLMELPYGLCCKELALRLGVSERTVRRMKEKLLRKTGLLTTGQLMIYALVSEEINSRSSSRNVDKG